jgi:LDH2 family malate/lactate/ureidoglycolate dehydrogenase
MPERTPTRPTRTVAAGRLRALMESLLRAAGCDDQGARACAEVFLEADLRGVGGQGLDHMPTMLDNLRTGRTDPFGRPSLRAEGPAWAHVEGNNGPGQIAGRYAADLAAAKAQESGVTAVGVVNSGDLFMIGFYAERIARAGCVGLVFSDAPPLVHPQGGIERALGTNPLAIAIPTSGPHPFLVDIATSAVSFSQIRLAAYHGESVAPDLGLDPEGRPSTEATQIARGALSPLGGHKGFGLGLCVALLSGPLVGATTGKSLRAWHGDAASAPSKGHLFLALNPAIFGGAEHFRRVVSAYLDEVRDGRRADGVEEIRIPGERAFAARERSLEEGVPVYEAVWGKTAGWAEKLGVEMPD